MQKARNVGVVGLGVIGRAVCRAVDTGIPGLRLSGALARDRGRAETFLAGLETKPPFLSLDDLVAAADLVVEASTQAHLEELAPRVLG
ncbi:MAG: Gfo/Idh/MocA family oxidoreductase, partial [Candidatus Rokuibacteriota bacterium]